MIAAQKIKHAALWSIFESILSIILNLAMILFIARLLNPIDYGKIALAQMISGLLQIALGFGLSETVIQKNKLDILHIHTFWSFSIVSGLIGSLLCVLIGYFFTIYSDDSEITYILYFEAITIFFLILSLVPISILFKKLNIKQIAFINIFSKSIFFIFAIPMMYLGYGLWSVVIGTLMQSFIYCILVNMSLRKQIYLKFFIDFQILKESYQFGFFVMLENLLWNVLSRVLGIFIATFHGSNALGLYNMASKLVDTITAVLNMTITRLTLPIFASLQDNRERLLESFQKATLYFNIVSIPAFFFMAITAKYWVLLVLGDQWLNIVPIIQILAVMYGIMYSRIFVGNTIKALGKSKEYLYLSVTAAIITLSAIFFTKNQSLFVLLLAIAIPRVVITLPLGMILMKKICGFSFLNQNKVLGFPMFLGVVISSILFILQIFFQDITWVAFIVQLLCCGVVFVLLTYFYLKRYSHKIYD